jgi:hypothetical protein
MKISISAVVAVLIAAASANAGTSGISGSGVELLVVGPVESINVADRSATVLGQRVETSALEQLNVGDAVAVFGLSRPDGSIAATSIQPRGAYVAGASPIFLAGTVQKAEPAVGRVVVNGVAIDLTSAMSHGSFAPSVGSKLTISGTQPSGHGVVLVSGISGSGVDGISGSGVNGISGSGIHGISGSGVDGISGSGVHGISGSGVNGISGSGIHGISGSGLRHVAEGARSTNLR